MANLATEVKLYGRWSFEDVEVKDISLEDYIACKPKYAQFLPHSQGRWQKKRFRKAQCPIVERLVCSIMRKGRNNGKKVMAVRIVKHAFEIIHLLTDQNPVQVFVEAVVNCGPREDSTRVGGGGAVRRQACDVSPLALLALRSAPALSSAPTHASKPYDAATISAVRSFPLRASTGAFASIRGLIISTWQPCAAKWSAV